MRLPAAAAALMLIAPSFAAAQSSGDARVPVERRVDSLEKQMRSVQRRVFASNASPGLSVVPDDVRAPATTTAVSAPVADLAQRVDALERQLAIMTGQVEENGNAIRQLDARIDRLDAGAATPAAAISTPAPIPEPIAASPEPVAAFASPVEPDPPSADPAENAYLAGYRLWEAKRYEEAAETLKTAATRYAKHRRASWSRNLLGRTYLDDNKPATAAEAFLSNYQELPQGERAADSLYFLGAALMKLNKPEQACKVYDELTDVYGTTMRDYLKQNLPAAKKAAKCR